MKTRWLVALMLALVTAFLLVSTVSAQDAGGNKRKISDDEVNTIAQKLYCPVCENIPLDTCGTAACAQWRDEIRIQLEDGETEQQIINNFVTRYGDRVVGTPQDPTLRALSLVTPWIISAVALVVAIMVFVRWRLALARAPGVSITNAAVETRAASEYRARLERDVANRR